jgi:hypothetical protein
MEAHEGWFRDGPLLDALDGEVTTNGQVVEEHRPLGGEVAKNGATTNPGSFRDLIDRGLGVALFHE